MEEETEPLQTEHEPTGFVRRGLFSDEQLESDLYVSYHCLL